LAPPAWTGADARIQAPIPWNIDQTRRLANHITYVNRDKSTRKTLDFYKVLDAGQYLDVGKVIWLCRRMMIRKDRIDSPTDWVVNKLLDTTRMKLRSWQLTEETMAKFHKSMDWLNRKIFFTIPLNMDEILPTIYDVDFKVVMILFQTIHDMGMQGDEEVLDDPAEYIISWCKRWKKDEARFDEWVHWQNTYGGLKQPLERWRMRWVWKTYDRGAFWAIIKASEDALVDKEDPTEYLLTKLQLPAAISQVSRDQFRNMLDVKAVQEAAEGMEMESIVQVLESSVRRRWEIDESGVDATGFVVALLKEAREEGGGAASKEDDSQDI